MVQEKLNLTLRRKELPYNLCCGLLGWKDLIDQKKKEARRAKYFSSTVNDEYKSRCIGESSIISIFQQRLYLPMIESDFST